jgi:two-component system, chemotaxis family, protein-glutamate methylesterase/glutaminase
MRKRDIVVIGASAGGVEALRDVASQLPVNFPGAVFAVLHMLPHTRSFLPEILGKAGPLSAVHPKDGDAIEHGKIYLAPPDRHLVIERDHVHLSNGPKEQRQRPCINVTLRSAALAYGERVVGVILTGQMDDGTAGLWEVKRRGGVTVVQNPEEAPFPSMPLSALREIEVDHTVSLDAVGALLRRLAEGEESKPKENPAGKKEMEPRLTDLTCPDCRGTIWETPLGNGSEYRCRVGHTFSPATMLAEHHATQERALYAAIVALEEGASLATRLADKLDPELCRQLLDEARIESDQAEALRKVLRDRRPLGV